MGKKQYYLIVDSETTITEKVVDFGAIICDRNGNIVNRCAVLINGIFGVDTLFYDTKAEGIWSKASIERRMSRYTDMLNSGIRMLASVNAVNRWLEKAKGQYNPTLTAYNLPFDNGKCRNTNIDLTIFENQFCLWAAAVGNICNTKKYREFVLQHHLFNKPTEKGNMTFSTTAESVTKFITGNMQDEPHTAIEDIIEYELPTLVHILKKRDWKDKVTPYAWSFHQVRDHYQAR